MPRLKNTFTEKKNEFQKFKVQRREIHFINKKS